MQYTIEEIERMAYVANDQRTLALLESCALHYGQDTENAVIEAREKAYSEGYKQGARDASGADLAAKLEEA